MRRVESRSFRAEARCAGAALLAAVALLAGCGKSSPVTGSSDPVVAGNAVLLGTVQGVGFAGAPVTGATHQSSGGTGYTVTVVGAAGGTVEIDEDGRFVLAGLPAGAVTLRIEGGGVSAQVTVQGLVDGQVLTVEMKLTGGTVQLTGSPTCAPIVSDTFFSGDLESISPTQIVVSRRVVDVTKLQKVWTPGGRAQMSDLKVGDRIKVWGTLRGDGVVVADEIMSVTNDAGETWFSFKGRVDGISGSTARALDDVHGSPNAGYSPTLSIAGKTVYTSGSTKFKWLDGGTLDPRELKVGQTAYVEGYRNKDGALKASSVVVEGSGGTPSLVSFRGKVAGVVALSARDVAASCNLKLTVGGRKVETDGSTDFRWSDGSSLDPYAVKDGQTAYVEGWNKGDYVLATKFVVDK
jgi:hypothetical protein